MLLDVHYVFQDMFLIFGLINVLNIHQIINVLMVSFQKMVNLFVLILCYLKIKFKGILLFNLMIVRIIILIVQNVYKTLME